MNQQLGQLSLLVKDYDEAIRLDPNDATAVEAFWVNATITRGKGRPPLAVKRPTLNMRVDAEVLEAFKATGLAQRTL